MMGLLRRRGNRTGRVLETPRLRLIAMTVALVGAEAQDTWRLGEALGARLANDWPPELWEAPVRAHIVAQLTERPDTVGWHRYMVLTSEAVPSVVGCLGAFPCASGDVELGYSVTASWQRRGLATEAAGGLIRWLLEQEPVHSVSAQAYASSAGSVKVMQRCGMQLVGPGDEDGTVRYRRWR